MNNVYGGGFGQVPSRGLDPFDDETRDYRIEGTNDVGAFDLFNDLSSYFLAEFLVERAWDDRQERRQLLQHYGFRGLPHYRQVKATVERFMQSPQAAQRYGTIHDMMHLKMRVTQDYLTQGRQAQLQPGGALHGEMAPVEGVDLPTWASAMAYVAQGGTLDDVTRELRIDAGTWERVSAEWNARMSRDTTATIATVYGNAFTKAQANPATAGAGGPSKYAAAAQNPGKGEMPMSLERYVEVLEAQNALTAQGQDAQAVLKKLGLSVLDWSNLGAWFSAYINENALRNNSAIINDYNKFTEKYKAKYATVKSDADISF